MNRKRPKLADCPWVLIVEGVGDLLFYAQLLEHLQRWKGVFIHEMGGSGNIRKKPRLEEFLTPKLLAEKAGVGILIDADRDPGGTAKAISGLLSAITGRSVCHGEWQESRESQPEAKLGFFVVPSPTDAGEMETLLWQTFPETSPHREMKSAVESFLKVMSELGWQAQPPQDKARIAAYLAAAYDDDPRPGPGARAGKFDLTAPALSALNVFLSVLPMDR